MVDKHIADLIEDTTPVETSDLIIQQPSGGLTRKAKLINLLKNVFTHKDVYSDYVVNGLDLDHPGGSAAPSLLILRDGFYQHAFNGTSQINEGHFTIHTLHDLKPNTDMTVHIHWSHNNAAPSGNVKWNVAYSLAKGNFGTFGAATNLSVTQAAGAQYYHHITNDDSMVINGTSGQIEPDTIIILKIWRDPSDVADTFADYAFLLNIDIHYIKSRVGTTERNRPYTSGGF